jgi:NTE family protein
MLIPPYRITLSGGGLKGVAHIGALEVLSERGLLKALREYVGISAGALVAFCLCIGSSLSELRMITSLLDFGLVRDLDAENMLNFTETYGLDTGANVEKLLKAILRARRIDPEITFRGLAELRLGPNLRVIAMNLNTCCPEEFSATKSPDMPVYLAIRASMSLPIYFTPVQDPKTGHYYSDGGVNFSSPFKFLSDEERKHTLSIAFNYRHKPKKEIPSLQAYLYQLYYCLDYDTMVSLDNAWASNILYINCHNVYIMNFELSQEDKIALMDSGRSSAEEFLKGGPGRKPARRFSFS